MEGKSYEEDEEESDEDVSGMIHGEKDDEEEEDEEEEALVSGRTQMQRRSYARPDDTTPTTRSMRHQKPSGELIPADVEELKLSRIPSNVCTSSFSSQHGARTSAIHCIIW